MENEEKKEQNEESELLGKLEAALFIAARWLRFNEIVSMSGINPVMARELLQKLEQKYAQQKGGITLAKRESEGQELWKMDVLPQHAYLAARLATGEAEFTKSEQATLAIIAYKQPMRQSAIVKVRGNKAYDHIKKLIESNLVHSKKAGRTFMLTLTDHFYDYFGLKKGDSENREIKMGGENADNPGYKLFDLFGEL
jgi:segregation and condensation protein B